MYRILLILVLALLHIQVHASWTQRDSIEINKGITAAKRQMLTDMDGAKMRIDSLRSFAMEVEYDEGYAIATQEYFSYFLMNQQYDSARYWLDHVLAFSKKHQLGKYETNVYLQYAALYNSYFFRPDSGFIYSNLAMELATQRKDSSQICNALIARAENLKGRRELSQMNETLEELIELSRSYSSKRNFRYHLYFSILMLTDPQGVGLRAKLIDEYLQISSSVSILEGKKESYHRGIITLGYSKDLSKKEELLLRDLAYHKEKGYRYGVFFTHLYLTDFYSGKGQWRKAEGHLGEALSQAELDEDLDWRLNVEERAAIFYEKIGRQNKALKHYKNYFAAKDSAFKQNVQLKARELEAKYKAVEQEAALTQQQILIEKEKARKLRWFYLLGGLGVLIMLILFFLNNRVRNNRLLAQKNEVIQVALEEKDVLLREIHHRVKNNLQVISSLLSLQSRRTDDPTIQRALQDGRNRVRSMALIHQNLYQDENLIGVDTRAYINKLATNLLKNYKVEEHDIHLTQQVDPLQLDVDTIIPVGLILNELISNSLKYAFPETGKGEMLISFTQEGDYLHLQVEDNGKGLEEDFDWKKSKSLGFRLVRSFAEKLKAELHVSTEKGTKVWMKIPYKQQAAI
ncbi:MAG: sensor histidine kinase [Bacteroidota bacterium]